MQRYISWYEKNILPSRTCSQQKYAELMQSAQSDKDRAHLLLVGNIGWPIGCHQWFLKMRITIYHQMIDEIIRRKLWTMPLQQYATFEELYKSLEEWMNRPYIRQLTIYDVATRIVIVNGEYRLMPRDYVYLHAKPRAAYAQLLKKGCVTFKPKGWNVVIPKYKMPEFGNMDSYSIEDLLCAIKKGALLFP